MRNNDVNIQMTPKQYEAAEKLLENLALQLDTNLIITNIADGSRIMIVGGRL